MLVAIATTAGTMNAEKRDTTATDSFGITTLGGQSLTVETRIHCTLVGGALGALRGPLRGAYSLR